MNDLPKKITFTLYERLKKRIFNSKPYNKIDLNYFPVGMTPISDTKDNDVFIVGFPKSGNTLMQHIISHLVYGLNENVSRSLINFISPDIYTNRYYFRFNDTCFFKSHNLPEKRYRKVIYIMRDGREAILSYHHMMKNMGMNVSLEELYTGEQKIFNVHWDEHIKSWEKNPFSAEILWIKYEDLLNNKFEELKKICIFLKLDRNEKELSNVMKYTSFEFMKALENKGDWVQMKKGKFLKGKNFVRKGKLDTFKFEVSEELLKKFEELNSDSLNKYYV
ncbi:MAG: hypothetical protein BM564_00025 [Bacteroidetes bacterium MedPE-SWsnd-G2]|nr:MAG: hypothetical protein BM564_00025 [Bacteroidetes bacterium MedPE-SWsnd-G2]